jgi:hypothetical protein
MWAKLFPIDRGISGEGLPGTIARVRKLVVSILKHYIYVYYQFCVNGGVVAGFVLS